VSIDGSVETIVDDIVRQLRLSPADSGASAGTVHDPYRACGFRDVDGTLLTKDGR
jgi:hypothetical protein